MSYILWSRTILIFSSVSKKGLKKLFGNFRYSSLTHKLLSIKGKQCFLPTTSQRSTITAFSASKGSRNGIDSTKKELDFPNIKTVKAVSKILQCSKEELLATYHNHNELAELQVNDFKDRVKTLQSHGIDIACIKQNVWILALNPSQLSSRLELLKKWNFTNLNNALGLLKLPFTKLKKLTLQTEKDFVDLDGQNRITYFSSLIKCGEKEACELFVKRPFMMTITLENFKAILSMAKGMGVLKEDLLSDPWLFTYSLQFISNRIKFLEEIDARERCKVIKPWMLRCSQSIVNRYFELKDENIAALGSYTNLKDLLSNELGLSDAEVEEMFAKHPPLTKIRYSKAKEMIDFLKSEGFGSKMIYQVPRVLCHKQATLLARMLELKRVNPRMMSLQNLCRNKKDYLAFLNKVQGSHS